MQSAGVIQGYTIRIDPAAISFSETVMVKITLENHNDATLFEFGKALEEIPEVLDAYLISGDYHYLIRLAVRDTRDYLRLLREQLYKLPGTRHSKSSFVLRRLKESTIPLPTLATARRILQKKMTNFLPRRWGEEQTLTSMPHATTLLGFVPHPNLPRYCHCGERSDEAISI